MSGGPNEEEAGVHPQVGFLTTLRLLLLPHIGLVLIVNEVNDGSPGVTVVDIVSKTGSINDGKLDFERFFFQLGLDDFDLKRGSK